MFTASTKIRVRYAETDQMGVVYHGNYFAYFEAARGESMRDMGVTYVKIEQMGIIMPIVDVQARFIRPALYDDLLTVKTILKEIPRNHRIEYHHEVYNEREELLTTATVVLYFMEKKTLKKTTIPEDFRKILEPYFHDAGK